jgi:hypothetical protein
MKAIENQNIDYNALGSAMNIFSHAAGAFLEDITNASLPDIAKAPDIIDSLLDKLSELGITLGGLNFSGDGSEPGDQKGWTGMFTKTTEWWDSHVVPFFKDLFGDKEVVKKDSSSESNGSVEASEQVSSMALGGSIIGPSHAGGGVPIIAEGGEFVVNQKTMDNYGPLIEELNTQGAKQYHLGGYVSKISATATNGIQTYRVSGREETQKSRQTEELEPKDINVNIKLSDLFVRGDGTGKIDMQSLVNDSAFVNKIKEMILASLDNKSDIAEKKI